MIVCEDGETEPRYFRTFAPLFPRETLYLKAIGTGQVSKWVVEKAIAERQLLAQEAGKEVDEVWAVFDKDDAQLSQGATKNFEDALLMAKQFNIGVGYSNEVFELWLLLHFSDVSPSREIPRQEIYSRLEKSVRKFSGYENFEYVHGKPAILDLTHQLGDESKAIERAHKLVEAQSQKTPITANPSTKVHLLVNRLRDLIEYYQYQP